MSIKRTIVNEVPATLDSGVQVFVGAESYIGNSNNEPVPVREPIPVLSALPATDPAKAGQKFSLNGTVWVYNYEDNGVKRFAGLDIGVPWPVKGYGALSFKCDDTISSIFSDRTLILDDFLINDQLTITRDFDGYWIIDNPLFANPCEIFITPPGTDEGIANNVGYFDNKTIVSRIDITGAGGDIQIAGSFISINIHPPLPE